VVDAFNVARVRSVVADELKRSGLRVIIAKGECSLQSHRREKYVPLEFDESYSIIRERCQRCGTCYKEFGCPAIMEGADEVGEYYLIDEETCVRCGACRSVCPNSAIILSRLSPRGKHAAIKAGAGSGQ
jgi:indolepyruvate ferredoxin oxidoreductase alpha subunit